MTHISFLWDNGLYTNSVVTELVGNKEIVDYIVGNLYASQTRRVASLESILTFLQEHGVILSDDMAFLLVKNVDDINKMERFALDIIKHSAHANEVVKLLEILERENMLAYSDLLLEKIERVNDIDIYRSVRDLSYFGVLDEQWIKLLLAQPKNVLSMLKFFGSLGGNVATPENLDTSSQYIEFFCEDYEEQIMQHILIEGGVFEQHNFEKMIENIKKIQRQEQQVAFLMGSHPRIGAGSSISEFFYHPRIDRNLLRDYSCPRNWERPDIFGFLQPSCETPSVVSEE